MSPEEWTVEPLVIPPRSQLLPLPPIGAGTAGAESLTSYLRRLAAVHRAPVARLITLYIAPALNVAAETTTPAALRSRFKRYLYTDPLALNRPTSVGAIWSRALAKLTGRHDVQLLTLAPWRSVLPPLGIPRTESVYCGDCQDEWRWDGEQPRDLLIWSVRGVDVCVRHCCRLSNECGACGRVLGVVPLGSPVGECPHCGAPLRAPVDNAPPSITDVEVAFARSVEQLIIRASAADAAPPVRLVELVHAGIGSAGSAQALALALGFGKSQLSEWRNGHITPPLDAAIAIANFIGVDFAAFMLGEVSQITPVAEVRTKPTRDDRMAWEQVRALLVAAVSEDPAPTLRSVVARTGRDLSSVRRRLPDECAALRERWASWRTANAAERRRGIDETVTSVVNELRAEGLRPSRRVIEPRLPGLSIRERQVADVWRKAVASP